MEELITIKFVFGEDKHDYMIVTTTEIHLDEILKITEYEELLSFLQKNDEFYKVENHFLEHNVSFEIDFKEAVSRFVNYNDVDDKYTVKEYLTNLGFKENEWGFLTGVLNDITYVLAHDPLKGYFLQFTLIKKREGEKGNIPLGKKPTVRELKFHTNITYLVSFLSNDLANDSSSI